MAVTTAVPDNGGLAALACRIAGFNEPVYAAIESMNGARFVHDQLEMAGWQVAIADAQKVIHEGAGPAKSGLSGVSSVFLVVPGVVGQACVRCRGQGAAPAGEAEDERP